MRLKHRILLQNPEAALKRFSHVSPPFASREPQLPVICNPQACRWRPYSSSGHFESSAAVIIVVVMSALVCALSLGTAIRCFLRGGGSRIDHPPGHLPQTTRDQEQPQPKPNPQTATALLVAAPATVYTAGMVLAGTDAECTICLSEFEEGDVIQVMERCKHGFHVACIQQWLLSHSSCPTCRTITVSSSPMPEGTTNNCASPSSQPRLT